LYENKHFKKSITTTIVYVALKVTKITILNYTDTGSTHKVLYKHRVLIFFCQIPTPTLGGLENLGLWKTLDFNSDSGTKKPGVRLRVENLTSTLTPTLGLNV